jgi:hypothetical protein
MIKSARLFCGLLVLGSLLTLGGRCLAEGDAAETYGGRPSGDGWTLVNPNMWWYTGGSKPQYSAHSDYNATYSNYNTHTQQSYPSRYVGGSYQRVREVTGLPQQAGNFVSSYTAAPRQGQVFFENGIWCSWFNGNKLFYLQVPSDPYYRKAWHLADGNGGWRFFSW